MSSAEGSLPTPSGLGRLIDFRLVWRDGALLVLAPAYGFLIGGVAVAIGLGVSANGIWGRTGDAGQVAFGVLYALCGGWSFFVTARPWVSADAVGLRVGVLRRQRVPWAQLTGLTIRNTSARGVRPLYLGVERRGARTLRLLPVSAVRSAHTVSELRFVAKRLAMEAERHGQGPISWPEHVTYRTRSGETHQVQ